MKMYPSIQHDGRVRFRLLAFCAALVLAGCAGAEQTARTVTPEPITLFDGTSLDGWEMAGPDYFVVNDDGSMTSQGGMGLLTYAERPFRDFILELEFKTNAPAANSGIFVRFPEKTDDPWDAVRTGYEIQIDDSQDPLHVTGSVYGFSPPSRAVTRPVGAWNSYRIEVRGQHYQIYLNGEKVNDFFGDRGREGYIGLQNHDPNSQVSFRNIRVTPLPDTGAPESLAEHFAVRDERAPIRVLMVTATHGWRHGDAIEAAKAVFEELETTTEFRVDTTGDTAALTAANLANYDLLFFNNSTLASDVGAAGAAPASSDDRSYGVSLETGDGTLKGTLALNGPAGAQEGSISFEGYGTMPLRDIAVDGEHVTFNFEGGQYGTIRGRVALQEEALSGTLTVGGASLPLTGTRNAAAASAAVAGGVTEAQRQAIMDFLRAGKGIVVAHAGLDAFPPYPAEKDPGQWPAYREMVGGGLFQEHPWTQSVRIKIEEPSNPAVAHFGDGFWIRDEIYVLDQNPRWNSRVLASLDMQSVGVEQGPADVSRNDYPISWIRTHNGGRVFVTKLGHFPDVWRNPGFLQHILQGMRMAAGRIAADFSGHRVKETVAENVWPDDIAVDDRGNVWIAELRGKVHLYDAATGTTRQIGLIPTTNPEKIEHGLYGIEVDPDFYTGAPFVYVYYAEPETFINTLARFEYREGNLDMASKKVLLRVPTEPNCCHQAGDLEWGPDGTLYLSTGDTGMSEVLPNWEISEARIAAFLERNNLTGYQWVRLVDSERSAQNLQDLRGKILRINRDGTIPRDNPFFGEPGVRWEIYAYGLRNPYRFKVDPETGALYIGVVGPDSAQDYDEYNVSLKGGENFGWPRTIGRLFFNEWTPEQIPGYVPPMWEYTYEAGGRSATVGPIYRSDGVYAFPEMFQDKLFVYDWSRQWIKWGEVADRTFVSDTTSDVKAGGFRVEIPAKRLVDIKTFDVLELTRPISMEVAPDGSIYLAEFDGFWDAGPNARVTRYRWLDGDEPPVGRATGVVEPGADGRRVRFDAGGSFDPNADALSYAWSFGDGHGSTERSPVHAYERPGSYVATLVVRDATGRASLPVTVPVVAGETTTERAGAR